MLSQVRQKLTQSFLTALHENEIPWHRCWGGTRPLDLQTGREYRGVNNLFLSYAAMEKGYRDPRWMTLKQAADRGWHVRKGEKAERVEFWHYYDSRERMVIEEKEVRRMRLEEPEHMRRSGWPRIPTAYSTRNRWRVWSPSLAGGVPMWSG